MRFGFLNTNIGEVHRYDKREAFIGGFLMERSINIVYGQAGLGKTWALFAIAKTLVDSGCDVVYLDSDNGADIIKDRGYDKHIEAMGTRFTYINGDLMADARVGMAEVFKNIEDNAVDYNNAIFIYDSISFFLGGGIYDENKLDKLMIHFKKIRRAGGTVIAINHTTKKGDAMKGGGTLINACDEVWEASKLSSFDDVINFCFKPTKSRLSVVESAFEVCTKNLSFIPKDKKVVGMSAEHKVFVDRVIATLDSRHDPISQSEILSLCGKGKADKTALLILSEFVGVFWVLSKKGNTKLYGKL